MLINGVVTVAVLFASKSGMGDVGKFVTMHGLNNAQYKIKPICIEHGAQDPGAHLVADVTGPAATGNDRLKAALEGTAVAQLDCSALDFQSKLEEELEGADAVCACIGNRQPKMPRWCESGAVAVTGAMKSKGLQRLVILSSFGIGEKQLPTSAFTIFWQFLLSTAFRSTKKDLFAMEKAVMNSNLDYLLVRPMGLTPEEPPKGSWHVLTGPGQGKFKSISVSKEDVAAFMLKECREPTIHRAGVTIGCSND